MTLDVTKGLPFSPFECTEATGIGSWKANADAVAEIFAYIASLGDMQRDVVFTSILDAYRACGFYDDMTDDEVEQHDLPTLAQVMQKIEQNKQKRHISNVSARCRRLLDMGLFNPQTHTADLLTLAQIAHQHGLIIDLHRHYSEDLQLAAGAFILRKIYQDMFHWGKADRLRLAIVLDEAHRLAKDTTLPRIMKEGRKFGVAVIVASQGLDDFHPDIVKNVGSKILFRMNFPESRKAAGFIRGRSGQDLAARIEQLAVGSAYVQTPTMNTGEIVQMHPLKNEPVA